MGRLFTAVITLAYAVALTAGCGHFRVGAPTDDKVQVIRYGGVEAKIMVASEARVREVCWDLLKAWERKTGNVARNDDGTPVTAPPPCCVRPASEGKMAIAFIPREQKLFKWCAYHEPCHLFNPGQPEKCDGVGYVK